MLFILFLEYLVIFIHWLTVSANFQTLLVFRLMNSSVRHAPNGEGVRPFRQWLQFISSIVSVDSPRFWYFAYFADALCRSQQWQTFQFYFLNEKSSAKKQFEVNWKHFKAEKLPAWTWAKCSVYIGCFLCSSFEYYVSLWIEIQKNRHTFQLTTVSRGRIKKQFFVLCVL